MARRKLAETREIHVSLIRTHGLKKPDYKHPDGTDARDTEAERTDTVVWQFLNGDYYAIVFKDRSPFAQAAYSAQSGDPIAARVRADARRGKYPYSVVVVENGQAPILDDPQVIIN